MDSHTLAYVSCTSFSEIYKLDRAKDSNGKLKRANNEIRLAKMEQLQLALELEYVQAKIINATKKLNDLVSSIK